MFIFNIFAYHVYNILLLIGIYMCKIRFFYNNESLTQIFNRPIEVVVDLIMVKTIKMYIFIT